MERSWTPILRSLAEEFQSHERELGLIRAIDQTVIRNQLPSSTIRPFNAEIDELVALVCTELVGVTGASTVGLYLLTGRSRTTPSGEVREDFFRLYSSSGRSEALPPELDSETSQYFLSLLQRDRPASLIMPTRYAARLMRNDSDNTSLALPINSGGDPYGVIVLSSPIARNFSRLNTVQTRRICTMTADQFGIAIDLLLKRDAARLIHDFIAQALDSNLKPAVCLKALANAVANFLPSYGPFLIDPPPKAQILYYEEPDKFLTIRGSIQEADPLYAQVNLTSSICGLLIERLNNDPDSAPFLVVDPHEYPARYQWFLAQDQPEAPHSEMCVAALQDSIPIAVVNLEHSTGGVFLRQHIDGLVAAASALAPFLGALQEREGRQRTQRTSMLYAVDRELNRYAEQLNHQVGNPLANARLRLDKLRSHTAVNQDGDLSEQIETLSRYLASSADAVKQLAKTLPLLLVFDRRNVKSLVDDVLRRIKVPDGIELNLDIDDKIEIYASGFIETHLFNLIENALHSVQLAITSGLRDQCSIKIRAYREDVRPMAINGSAASGGTSLCRLVIHDNGIGVAKSVLPQVGTSGFTTKGPYGSGHGLSAAVDYFQSIRGNLTWDSVQDEFFEVKGTLEIIDEAFTPAGSSTPRLQESKA